MDEKSLADEIKKTLKVLGASKPFANFNLSLSDKEINSLKNIRICIPKVYDNFGKQDSFANELNDFIKSLNQNNNNEISQFVSTLINKLVNEVILGFDKENAWVTVRASIPTHHWDIPRWHTDGYYYSPYIGEQYKIVITLKGPSSLFYPLPNELREKFYSLQFNSENREALASMLDMSQSVSALPGQGTIYIVGKNYSAVHSEPPIHEERLFLSIVPGSRSEIHELYNNWHQKSL